MKTRNKIAETMTPLSRYFLSYGTRANEFQVWQDGILKYKHQEASGIKEYIQLQIKHNPELEIIGIGETDSLAKKIMEELKSPRQ